MTRKTPVEVSMASIRKEIEKRMQSSYDSGYQEGFADGLKAAHEQIVAIAPSPRLPLPVLNIRLSNIDVLGLSIETFNPLHRQGITTIAQLIQFSGTDLLDIRLIGNVRIKEINDRLSSVGLCLSDKSAFTHLDKFSSVSTPQEPHADLPVSTVLHGLGLRPETQTYLMHLCYFTIGNVIDYLKSMNDESARGLCDRLYLDEIKLVMAIHGYEL